ncbi:HAD family hydrolase [Nonomuraea typhae]|uniref:HAD family hydrolase n=1 Tax=Nonomuraea typhae TaxID=2603600 RepID=A0ABW7YQ71_9ACTN
MTLVKAVVLDLDGTLVDTPRAIATITGRILEEFGVSRPESDIVRTVGKPLDHNFAYLLDRPLDHPDIVKAAAAYRDRFGQYVKENRDKLLYPGVVDGLRELRRRGHRLAVATSKTYEGAIKTVRATGIEDLFDGVAGHDSVARGKPEPDLAIFAAGLLGVVPSSCVSVGDGVGDMQMGRSAGMFNVGVSYGVATAEELLQAGADVIADGFPEVVEAVTGRLDALR